MLMYIIPSLVLLLLMTVFDLSLIWTPSGIVLLFLFLFSLFAPSTQLSSISLLAGHLDQLSSLLILISIWVSALMIFASQKVAMTKNSPKMFLMLIVTLMVVLVLSFFSSSFLAFYILFEASLIPTLLLVLGWGYQPERLQASSYLILYTVTASLPLLISLMLLLKSSGHLSMLLSLPLMFSSASLNNLWWVVMIAAFLVKTPLYLTHLWLPKAHVEAPVAGSMVLAGVLLKLGSYGLLRLVAKFPLMNKTTSPVLMAIALVGGAITSLICVRQTDVKSLIAYSSVSHMGLASAGIFSGTSWGWQGALMMLIAHGLCSSCMFSLANMTYETINSRGMYSTKGLLSLFPSLSFWWFCFSACNMAAPPSLNLASEILLISSTMSASIVSAFPIAVMAFMAAAYSLFLYTSTQHGQSPKFYNPLSLFSPRNYSVCLLHFTPLVLIVLKLEFMMF